MPSPGLALPAGFLGTDVDMGEGWVATDASLVGEEGFDVGCHLAGGDAFYFDIGSPAVEVLGIGCPSHLAIMGRGAVGGCDGDRRAEV